MFFNELDILNLRLHELNDVVDVFVLVEATTDFAGDRKPLYYQENAQLFERFKHKIEHFVIDLPDADYWTRENYGRDMCTLGLDRLGMQANDIIVVCDVDEIPQSDSIKWYRERGCQGLCALEMDLYYYNLNTKSTQTWNKGKIMDYETFCLDRATEHRMRHASCTLTNAGWHLSYFGSVDHITEKLDAIADGERIDKKYRDPKSIAKHISAHEDLFDRLGEDFIFVEELNPDELPQYYGLITERTVVSHVTGKSFIVPKCSDERMLACAKDFMERTLSHEPLTNAALCDLIQKVGDNECVIDCGCHVGDTSLMLAAELEKAGKASKIIAIDPSYEKTEFINMMARANHLTSYILTVNCAVGSQDNGTGSLDKSLHAGAWHVQEGNDFEIFTLDTILKRFVPDHKVKLIKIDVEGYEVDVLQGASNALATQKPPIVIEIIEHQLQRRQYHEVDIVEILSKFGYSRRATYDQDVLFS